tara:strand:- start:1327 stop:1551 length:225 start_codon:yes stop_codon:yes gene_type:complete
MSKEDQLIADIAFCIDECDMNDEQIGHFIRASEELGVSCRYLAEEFLFETDTLEEFERLHLNPEYLKIKWRLDS